ncbi:hypothetical protein BOC49_08100 [Burkholderia pseudomallei]|nr:hypothetical protein BOC49_08100 [Burkholderia pseudomallei]
MPPRGDEKRKAAFDDACGLSFWIFRVSGRGNGGPGTLLSHAARQRARNGGGAFATRMRGRRAFARAARTHARRAALR